jgi:hypothetical protein
MDQTTQSLENAYLKPFSFELSPLCLLQRPKLHSVFVSQPTKMRLNKGVGNKNSQIDDHWIRSAGQTSGTLGQ